MRFPCVHTVLQEALKPSRPVLTGPLQSSARWLADHGSRQYILANYTEWYLLLQMRKVRPKKGKTNNSLPEKTWFLTPESSQSMRTWFLIKIWKSIWDGQHTDQSIVSTPREPEAESYFQALAWIQGGLSLFLKRWGLTRLPKVSLA